MRGKAVGVVIWGRRVETRFPSSPHAPLVSGAGSGSPAIGKSFSLEASPSPTPHPAPSFEASFPVSACRGSSSSGGTFRMGGLVSSVGKLVAKSGVRLGSASCPGLSADQLLEENQEGRLSLPFPRNFSNSSQEVQSEVSVASAPAVVF